MSLQPLDGYTRIHDGRWKITANHEIPLVSPTMIDWWWDHIDTTERYKQWHPTDHISFKWVIPPTNGHVGAIHLVEEFLTGIPEKPLCLEIRWEDPAQARGEYAPEYAHILFASGTDHEKLSATFMHEYEEIPGGTRMRSHFLLEQHAPEHAVRALYLHNKAEMGYLPRFLPQLHDAEVTHSC